MSSEGKASILEAEDIIRRELAWESASEGRCYWCTAADKLGKIALQKDTCESCGQVIP